MQMDAPKKLFHAPAEKTYDIAAPAGSNAKSRAVLLLEDDDSQAEILTIELEANNFQVTRVQSGVEGLKKIMSADFDVILCDMMMPNLPGNMFYLAVQRTKPHLCRRFVFMTGHKGDRKIDEFIRSVRGLILWKPFELHVLLDAINVILKKASEK